jgi:hypothetical protein
MWAKTQFDSLKLASSGKSIGETLDLELRTQLAKLNIVWRALLSFDAGGLLSALRADRTNRAAGRGARRAEAFRGLGLVALRKSPTHVDPRQTRLDIELRFQYTVGFDKSHTGVYREILCHCHIGAQLDSG